MAKNIKFEPALRALGGQTFLGKIRAIPHDSIDPKSWPIWTTSKCCQLSRRANFESEKKRRIADSK